MNSDQYKMLDNPVWNALQTVHKSYALGKDSVQRYPSDMLRILGCEDPDNADLNEIQSLVSPGEKLFMVGDLASIPANWSLVNKLDCVQMICPEPATLPTRTDTQIIELNEQDNAAMLELINLVQPGYFYKKTPLLGNYFGIKQDNQLVAMAGERLKMTGFTEISAVVTHPSFTGKGCAQQLVAHIANENINQENIPFLHFLHTNTRARKVYELLGFTERKIVPFWQLQMKGD